MSECPQGTCDQIGKLYEHAEKYVRLPGKLATGILIGFVMLVMGSIGSSVYSGYRVFYALNAIPSLQAAEKNIGSKVYKIEQDHAVLVEIVKTIANTQKEFAGAIKKQGEQIIELTTEMKNEKEQTRKINEKLLEELKRR